MKVRLSQPPGLLLGKLVDGPGGVTVTEAVAAAERGIESLSSRGRADIAQIVQHMQQLGQSLDQCADQAGGQGRRDGDAAALYAQSNVLVGVAAAFGMPRLGDVAFSLCALLEQFHKAGSWRMEPVRLHLDALVLLHGGGAEEPEISHMIGALRQVVDWVRSS